MVFGGGSKKKLAEKAEEIAAARREVAAQEEELARVNAALKACDEETVKLRKKLQEEKEEQHRLEAANAALVAEVAKAEQEHEGMKEEVVRANRSAEEARAEREKITEELARHEETVREQKEAAEAVARAAAQEAARLQEEQEAERRRWEAAYSTHAQLKAQVEAAVQKHAEIMAGRDRAKAELALVQSAKDLQQRRCERLLEDVKLSEEQVAQEEARRLQMEGEIAALNEEHKNLQQTLRTRQDAHRQQQFLLMSVNENVGSRREQLQRDLGEFQQQFQKAKVRHDQITSEHKALCGKLDSLMPEHFKQQTEQVAKVRELEQARRERELLAWEHHKVQRDLQMLAKSYDVGGGALPPR